MACGSDVRTAPQQAEVTLRTARAGPRPGRASEPVRRQWLTRCAGPRNPTPRGTPATSAAKSCNSYEVEGRARALSNTAHVNTKMVCNPPAAATRRQVAKNNRYCRLHSRANDRACQTR